MCRYRIFLPSPFLNSTTTSHTTRNRTRLKHRKPPELPKGFLAWVRPLMSISQERILQLAGLDAYMLLRYIRLCLKVRSSFRSAACTDVDPNPMEFA